MHFQKKQAVRPGRRVIPICEGVVAMDNDCCLQVVENDKAKIKDVIDELDQKKNQALQVRVKLTVLFRCRCVLKHVCILINSFSG